MTLALFMIALGLGFVAGLVVCAAVFWLIVNDEETLRGAIDH